MHAQAHTCKQKKNPFYETLPKQNSIAAVQNVGYIFNVPVFLLYQKKKKTLCCTSSEYLRTSIDPEITA